MLLFPDSENGIWVGVAGDLNADHIFHINTAYSSWPILISNCLTACDKRKITSIAFPSIGTGNVIYKYLSNLASI